MLVKAARDRLCVKYLFATRRHEDFIIAGTVTVRGQIAQQLSYLKLIGLTGEHWLARLLSSVETPYPRG